jgi:HPt (histidine-containing phosphotransfer) domain-containing protein
MALHYNLAKVHALSDDDPEFVMQIITLFVTEVPEDLCQIKEAINNKEYQRVFSYAHKVKPTLDLLGLNVAFEEIIEIEAWSKAEGEKKKIKEIFKSIKNQVSDAVKELKKDFDL